MIRIRPNQKIIKKLELDDRRISLLSADEVKKKVNYFAAREHKLKHLIEPRPISVRVKRLLAKRRSRQLKSRLSRLSRK